MHLVADGAGDPRVVAGTDARLTLHAQAHVVEPFRAGKLNVVLAAHIGIEVQHVGNLAGINVHATENDHVVRTPADVPVARDGAPAGAGFGNESAEVVRTVTDERHGFFGQRSHDHFADFAFGNGLERVGIDDLDIEKVRPIMDAFPDLAVQARSGAVHLGHARDVVAGLKAEFFGETLAHFEAVRLGTENDLLKCDLVAQIVALHFLGKEEGH